MAGSIGGTSVQDAENEQFRLPFSLRCFYHNMHSLSISRQAVEMRVVNCPSLLWPRLDNDLPKRGSQNLDTGMEAAEKHKHSVYFDFTFCQRRVAIPSC